MRRRCAECETVKDTVHKRLDPWEFEMNDREVWRWLCDDCYTDLAEEV